MSMGRRVGRFSSVLGIILGFALASFGDELKDVSARRELEKHQDNLAKLLKSHKQIESLYRTKHKLEKQEVYETTIANLKKVQKRALESDRVEDALAIAKEIEKLNVDIEEPAPKQEPPGIPAGQIPPALVGTKWVNSSGIRFSLAANGVSWGTGRADAFYFNGRVFFASDDKMQVFDFRSGKHLNYRHAFTLDLKKR